ncbi:hypothetical protein BH24ACT5_BH24ACT5_14260 [soil metagenome]
MLIATTAVPVSEAKARLSALTRRVHDQHERVCLTRNGQPQAVLMSIDDLEGLELTVEILSDASAAQRITESLAALERGDVGVDLDTVRADVARRRTTAT